MSSLLVRAPAKINLGLSVLGRRPDGYHEIESVMQQVSLADVLVITPARRSGVFFSCSDPALNGEDNLVYRAAVLLASQSRKKLSGVKLELIKKIPVEAGLAGGSSDAAAALFALNRFWRLDLSFARLLELGALLGSDIPFCLLGGTALATGRGERLQPLPDLPFFWVVLAVPAGIGLSTVAVYGALRLDSGFVPPGIKQLVAAIKGGNPDDILAWLAAGNTNALEGVALSSAPHLHSLKKRLMELGLTPVMSGSGPTFFALGRSLRLAGTAARVLQEEGYRAFLCWTEKSSQKKKVMCCDD